MDSIQGYDQNPSRIQRGETTIGKSVASGTKGLSSTNDSESSVSLTDISEIGKKAKDVQSEVRPDAIARAQALLDDPDWLNDRAIEALADKLIDIESI